MARTTFSGPVKSDNGFEGNLVSGTVSTAAASATVLTSASATVTNLIATSLVATSATIGNMELSDANAASGAVSAQLGYIPVLVGSTTAYIALYQSVTV